MLRLATFTCATLLVAAGCPSPTGDGVTVTPTTTSSSTTTSTTTSTVPASVNVTPFYGTFAISATRTVDTGCNFLPSFNGQVQITGNTDGSSVTTRMIEQATRTYTGAMQTNGAFTGSGSGDLGGGLLFTGQISSQTTGNAITGTETLNFTGGCPGKQVVYVFNGNK